VYAYTSELSEWLKTAESPLDAPGGEPFSGGEVQAVPTPAPQESTDTFRDRIGWLLAIAGAILILAIAGLAVYRRNFSSGSALANARPGAVKPSGNPEAESLYLQGMYYWNKRTPESLNQALDYFTQSIVRDPNYAPAYAGLANCYNLLREFTLMPAKDAYPRAMAAAKRAIALDDSLAEAHSALAFGDFYWSWDAPAAESEFRRAIALDPNSVVAHHWYATFLMVLGRPQEALEEIDKARKLSPESSSILADKGLILFSAGQTKEAIALLKQVETAEPTFLSPHAYLADVSLKIRDYKEYLAESKKTALLLQDQNRIKIATAGERGFAEAGGPGMLRAILVVQKELYEQGKIGAYELASTYCLLGDRQHALKLLQVAIATHDERDISLRIDPNLQALHESPAFRTMLTQVGLPPLG